MKNLKIGTIASHSALNILSGAKAEGITSVLYCKADRESFYRQWNVADEIITLDSYAELFDLDTSEVIMIPHGSFVAYLPIDRLVKSDIKLFGSKKLLEWESDRKLKDQLMKTAKLPVPKEFDSWEDVDRPVIIKYYGAEGGKGYFVAQNRDEIKQKADFSRKFSIQEYIVGTKVYVTFFQSYLYERTELFGADIRYETDIDAKLRFTADPTFTIVGNIPVVLRESLLIPYQKMAENFVVAAESLLNERIPGPFCLESIIDRNLNIYVFEFSGRIVAGTNVMIPSSPYSYIFHGEHMWMGRRIAREIKQANERGLLEELIS